MSCHACGNTNPKFQCSCCNRMYCNEHFQINASMQDERNFVDLEDKERKQRPPEFTLETICGPHCLLIFNYDGKRYYLFGEDHVRQPRDNEALSFEFRKHLTGFNFTGESQTKMYIERFFFLLMSQHITVRRDIYLEIIEKSKTGKPTRVNVEVDKIRENHLEKLFYLFQDRLEFEDYNLLQKRNVGVHPVDYRNGLIGFNVGNQLPDYISHYSLYYRLYETKKTGLIQELFDTTEEDWDVKLLFLTLFQVKPNKFREYANAFKDRFDRVYRRNKDNEVLEDFARQPGMLDPSKSYTVDGISLQADLYRQLPHGLQNIVRTACLHKCLPILLTNDHAFNVGMIGDFDAWFMDVPAMAKLFLTPSKDANVFGYFGADHITNMLNVVSQMDHHFDFVTNNTNAVTLPLELQRRFNELLLL